jgi:sorbitol-specific phosphotransferase system component IIC
MKKTGIILLIIGLIVTLFTGFTFITRDKVIDLGKVQVTAANENRVEWPPILGLMIMAVGGGLFLGSTMKKW